MSNKTMNLRLVPKEGPDFYPTPGWAVRGLLINETFEGPIHEPCCGAGNLSKKIEEAGYRCISSDLFDYGFGASGVDARTLGGPVENIITNPPYNLASELIEAWLPLCTGKIAILTRLSFLESKKRFSIFKKFPPAVVYIFSERLSLSPFGVEVKGGGTVSYCWIVWKHGFFGGTKLSWIAPGLKTKGLE